jgi:hypothetical protein
MDTLTKKQQNGLTMLVYASLLAQPEYDTHTYQIKVPFPLEKSAYFSNWVTFYDIQQFVAIDLYEQKYILTVPHDLREVLSHLVEWDSKLSLSVQGMKQMPVLAVFAAINLFGKKTENSIYISSRLDSNSIHRLAISLTQKLGVLVSPFESGLKVHDVFKLFSLHTDTLPSFDTMQFMQMLDEKDVQDIQRWRQRKRKAAYSL